MAIVTMHQYVDLINKFLRKTWKHHFQEGFIECQLRKLKGRGLNQNWIVMDRGGGVKFFTFLQMS